MSASGKPQRRLIEVAISFLVMDDAETPEERAERLRTAKGQVPANAADKAGADKPSGKMNAGATQLFSPRLPEESQGAL